MQASPLWYSTCCFSIQSLSNKHPQHKMSTSVHSDVESVVSSQYSTFDHQDDTFTTSTASFDSPKALFFNPAIPISYHKHHLRLSSDDGTFSTILKEDELCTVKEIIDLLQRKYEFEDVIIVLKDEETGMKKALQDTDKIIRLQNKLFRGMWIEEEQLPTAALKYHHHFKFLIHKF